MTKDDFNAQMKRMNDCFGQFPPSTYDSWFEIFQRFNALEFRNAVTEVISNLKTRPKPADVLEVLGQGRSGGGSQQVESNGCNTCGGSGFVQVEIRRETMSCMRCLCDRGELLSNRIARLTKEMLRERRINVLGQVVFKCEREELREYKMAEMTTPKTIEWARRGLEKSCLRSF